MTYKILQAWTIPTLYHDECVPNVWHRCAKMIQMLLTMYLLSTTMGSGCAVSNLKCLFAAFETHIQAPGGFRMDVKLARSGITTHCNMYTKTKAWTVHSFYTLKVCTRSFHHSKSFISDMTIFIRNKHHLRDSSRCKPHWSIHMKLTSWRRDDMLTLSALLALCRVTQRSRGLLLSTANWI